MNIQSKYLVFSGHEFPSCCQAFVIHGLVWALPTGYYHANDRSLAIKDVELADIKNRVLGNESFMVFAVTSSGQRVWEYVLEKLGFEKQRQYTARTGSLLTAWVFVPQDQEPYDDQDDDDENY